MTSIFTRVRLVLGALALLGLVAIAAPAVAQQSTLVNPTADAVKEDQLLRQLGQIKGRGTLPDTKSDTIEHPAGREWRHFHEVTLRWISAVAILGVLVLTVVFYLARGSIRLKSGRSGRTMVRFNGIERFVHWMTATCFVVLAITGLNITFGKILLLPLMGPDAFSMWSEWAKYAHNYVSFPFTLGVVLIFFIWIGGNIPNRVDWEWLKRGGGLVGHDEPPAEKFNAGQKGIYWLQLLGGAAMIVSGYLLIFPFYGTNIGDMESAQVVHGIIAMLFIALILAHIYIGTIGMEGAFEAMGSGEVDVNWAKEHHSLWFEEEAARGRSAPPPKGAAATPAE
jgi:formate dehydrogenase subunit gamma